jgi:8-oxo-dGTP diphosphatase
LAELLQQQSAPVPAAPEPAEVDLSPVLDEIRSMSAQIGKLEERVEEQPAAAAERVVELPKEDPAVKLEDGESVAQALARELHEELGIRIGAVLPWRIETVSYKHARVRLHFCKVFDWHGPFEMREGQRMAWQRLPVSVRPVLPGTLPVLQWFAAEQGFAGATHTP